MQHTHRRLKVFISSTGDLTAHRDAVEKVLESLDIDGIRFEAWPSAPRNPIAKCLDEVRSSDAMVLILGDRYGTAHHGGVSVTHLEYKEARNYSPPKPVFAYVLPSKRREKAQKEFVTEVERSLFRSCQHISDSGRLAEEVLSSFLAEFARCFRDAWNEPERTTLPSVHNADLLRERLPQNESEAFPFLSDLYSRGDDLALHELRPLLVNRFGEASDLVAFGHMASLNLAMSGFRIDDAEVQAAIEYWESERVAARITEASRQYNLGNALGILARYEEAIGRFELALRDDPKMAEAWKNLGSAQEALKDIDSAERSYRKALAIDSRLFEARFALGQLLLKTRGNATEALQMLDGISIGQLSSKHQASVAGWKASAYQQLGEHEKAIGHVIQAIRLQPSAEWVWKWGARVHAVAWRAQREYLVASQRFFQRFTRRHEDDAEAWAEFAQILWLQHDSSCDKLGPAEACAAFEKAFALGAEQTAVLLDRFGHALQECGHLGRAEEAFRKAVELDPSVGYCLGVCLISQRRFEDALPYVLRNAESQHRDDRSWFQVGVCHENIGMPLEAQAAYIKAIHLNPEYPYAWYNLGGLYWNEREIRRALRIWKRALKKFPDFERAQEVADNLHRLGLL